jgi:predicted MFS family arabinose efflux permease
VVTLTQVGYGIGLLLVVPLGDLVDRRSLIIGQSLLSVVALGVVALAPTAAVFLTALAAVGVIAVVTQLLVAHASVLAPPATRGQVVGTVTSGIITGILLARAVSGLLSDLLGWRAVYALSAVANLVVAMMLIQGLPAQPRAGPRIRYLALIGSVFHLLLEERVLRIRAVLALLIFTAMTILWTPLVLPLREPPFALAHWQVGLFGLAGLVGALGAARSGRLADSGHAQRTTGVALVLMLLSWLPSAMLSVSLWSLIIGVLLIDFGLQSVHVANQSLIYRVRPEAQSRMTAAYMVFYSIGCALGSMVSTAVYARAGWPAVCLLGACTSALALAFWGATLRSTPGRAPGPAA